jgi:hypothetical protein
MTEAVDTELEQRLFVFAEALSTWLEASDDKRLKEFSPLGAWNSVLDRMVQLGDVKLKAAVAALVAAKGARVH